jgi:hypothetical protein
LYPALVRSPSGKRAADACDTDPYALGLSPDPRQASEAHRSISLLPDQLFSLARLSIVSMADCQSSSEADPSVSSSLTRFFKALDA